MKIQLDQISKRYHQEWIFKDFNHIFEASCNTGIIGSNGSGKSTLLKIISAAELPTKGKLSFIKSSGESIPLNEAYTCLSFAAPYIDLPQQLTAFELIKFHLKFKSFINDLSINQFLELVFLREAKDKLIKNYSSGMKQRLKLGLAICTRSEVLLLDEPCSNLDKQGVEMYHQLIVKYGSGRIVIIGSNEQEDELISTKETINIMNYK